ncbi:hypothetical protein WJX72_000338 [[Myrmecia] bisecta]|uniref:Cation/H+ exchanger transmembrane domain-containing protein n=1 Tax=[Myrmecia] bisecta TaxID=41462 RepID=A0AAW1QDY7_9CHLO
MVAESGGAEDYCSHFEVTYAHRVNNPAAYDWCTVPEHSYDLILFACLAVIAACLFYGRLSTLLVLVAGGAVQGLMFSGNLGRFGNSIAIWLGIAPYELFFYIFLPPLLFDAAIRIDFFLFKQMVVQVITLAFLVVGGTCALLIPIMLYVFRLSTQGWSWQHVALLGSILASTDAVAIVATMKSSGGPRRLRALLEGESLLNDASSITLFVIFLGKVTELNQDPNTTDSGWSVLGNVVGDMCKLAAGGLAIGLAFGVAVRYMLRYLRRKGAGIDACVGLTFGVAYLAFYVANGPCHFSGVIAVAVFGLHGASTSRWDMGHQESEAFEAFWDSVAFVTNAIIFFFAGASSINFLVRSSEELVNEGQAHVLVTALWELPLVWLVMFAIRFVLLGIFQPLFRVMRSKLSLRDMIFTTAAGLRGSISLILASAVVIADNQYQPTSRRIISVIILWTAGFVLLTLVINAPLLPLVLRLTGLNKEPEAKKQMWLKASRAVVFHTTKTIERLRDEPDEMLRGVDWGAVERYVDLKELVPENAARLHDKWWRKLFARLRRTKPSTPATATESHGETPTLDLASSSKYFGRPATWNVVDLEAGVQPGSDASGASLDSTDVPSASAASLSEPPSRAQSRLALSSSEAALSAASATLPFPGSATSSMSAALPPSGSQPHLVRDSAGSSRHAATVRFASDSQESGGEVSAEPVPVSLSLAEQVAGGFVMTAAGPLPLPLSYVGSRASNNTLAGPPNFNRSSQSTILNNLMRKSKKTAADLEPTGWVPNLVQDSPGCRPPHLRGPTPRLSAGSPSSQEMSVPAVWAEAFKKQQGATETWHSGQTKRAELPFRSAMRRNQSDSNMAAATEGGGPEKLTRQGSEGKPRGPRPPRSEGGDGSVRGGKSPRKGKEAAKPSSIELAGRQHRHKPSVPQLGPGELADARTRLAAGLKRYFHGKRAQGLLSSQGMRILDNACDIWIDSPAQKMNMWKFLERDAVGRFTIQLLAGHSAAIRKINVAMRQRSIGHRGRMRGHILHWLRWPFAQALRLVQWQLGRTMLLACEVAMEYMLGLSYSPQMQMLRSNPAARQLLAEVQDEIAKVWRFIIDREIEAPERFQAIQSYRATMAVLRQQGDFVAELFSSGVVDEMERDRLLKPIEKRERQLHHEGPTWKAPEVLEVLRNLPFARHLPKRIVEELLVCGRLRMYKAQDTVYNPALGGIAIVCSGLVRIIHKAPGQEPQEYFIGTGGMVGLYNALTGVALPGQLEALAEGNSLMDGPLIFHLHQSGVAMIRKRAAAREGVFQQMELDMIRMAGLFLVERLKPQLFAYLVALLSEVTLVRRAPHTLRGATDHQPRNQSLLEAKLAAQEAEEEAELDAEELLHNQAWDLYVELTRGLTAADVLEVPAGGTYRFRSHAVLLRGAMLTSPRIVEGAADPAAGDAGAPASPPEFQQLVYQAPFLLPLLISAVRPEGHAGEPHDTVSFTAGPTGATLLVCPTADGRPTTHDDAIVVNVNQAEGDAAAASSSQAAPGADPALNPKPAPPLTRSPSLIQLSSIRPLGLTTSDANELIRPVPQGPDDWWVGYRNSVLAEAPAEG